MKRFYIVEVVASTGNKHYEFSGMTSALKFANEQVKNGATITMFASN